jgi:integrase
MASLQIDPRTGYVIACFSIRRDQELKRFYLSLGTKDRGLGTGKRTFAQDFVTDVEDAAHGAIQRSDVVARIAKIPDLRVREKAENILAKAVEVGLGVKLDAGSIEGALNKWLDRQQRVVKTSTGASYSKAAERLLAYLGDKARLPLHRVTREMMEGFLAAESKTTSPSTAYLKVKILRGFFKDAQIRHQLASNPALGIKKSKNDTEPEGRRPFSLDQLKAIEKQCTDEWKGIFLFGLYSGQRLSDIANLRWHNLRMEGPEATWSLSFVMRKTGRQMDVPLSSPLRDYILNDLESSDDEDAFLFPEAAACTSNGHSGTLSNAFRKILKNAGVVTSVVNKNPKNPKGRAAKREASVYSFHSLRHSAVTLMKNAGISPEIVRDIVGHESTAVSRVYTHISHDAKAAALLTMPRLSQRRPKKPKKS